MGTESVLFLALLIFVGAALYSSVGHAGASGYLAAMALFGLAPLEMKPAALALNILVASISTTKYTRAGRFPWSIFWPFAVASIPFAFLGGLIQVPSLYYRPLVGVILIYAAYRMYTDSTRQNYTVERPVMPVVLTSGAMLGFISGLVGVGGGIFLSPLLIVLHWEEVKKVSGVAAAFILVNSIAGLTGFLLSNAPQLPKGLAVWAVAAVIGGYIGSEYGSRRLGSPTIRRVLALVLLLASVKMFVTA